MAIENETADALVAFIRKIVREEIANAQRNSGDDIETFRHCLVTAVQNTTKKINDETITTTVSADIKDLSTGEVMTSVSNKSGEVLEPYDTVRIYETNGSYNNRYIGLKCS